ncbi:E3 ubiquitin-protein ligase TRIM35-like [Stigmatopora nigra]
MAATASIVDNLRCPTCLNIFQNPVMLQCSHSFCRACVRLWWNQKLVKTCPVCRKKCICQDPPSNLTLKNICETFTQASQGTWCELHEEKMKLFCLDHQQCVCLVCRGTQIHKGHEFRPLEEVAEEHKEKLQKALQSVKEQLHDFTNIHNYYQRQANHIKAQRFQMERKINHIFEEFQRFLDSEKASMMSALQEEEREKSQIIEEKEELLSRDLAEISDVIASAEKDLTAGHVSFMNNNHITMSRIQQLPQKPKMYPETLLDEVKYLGNLKFTVWERMKEIVSYSPVILDPNTATWELSLSDDLTSVACRNMEPGLINPERQQSWRVLGSTLGPGMHVWDVEVGENNDWLVGVVGWDAGLPSSFVWGIRYNGERYTVVSLPYPPQELRVRTKVQRLRVCVDTNARSLLFSDSLTNAELYARTNIPIWPNLSDYRKFYPFFYTTDKLLPLKIIPCTISVQTQVENEFF